MRRRSGHRDDPAFVEGARRCPPENEGGPPGFERFLEAVLDPAHEEHQETIEWNGKAYEPKDMDDGLVRTRLENVAGPQRGARASRRREDRRGRTRERC